MSKETEKDTELEKEENTSAESEEVKEAADTAENATEDTEKKAEESETEKLKKELAEANDKYLRLMAEYDNFRKRSAKERLELTDTAKGNVINGFLPVFDNFERALGTETQDAVYKQGVILKVQKNFIKGGLKNEKDNKQKKCSGSGLCRYDDMCGRCCA